MLNKSQSGDRNQGARIDQGVDHFYRTNYKSEKIQMGGGVFEYIMNMSVSKASLKQDKSSNKKSQNSKATIATVTI